MFAELALSGTPPALLLGHFVCSLSFSFVCKSVQQAAFSGGGGRTFVRGCMCLLFGAHMWVAMVTFFFLLFFLRSLFLLVVERGRTSPGGLTELLLEQEPQTAPTKQQNNGRNTGFASSLRPN